MSFVKRPTVQLLLYLFGIAAVSWCLATLIAPLLPYPPGQVLRRTATVLAGLTVIPFALRIQRRSWASLGLEWSSRMRGQWVCGMVGGVMLFTLLFLVLHRAGVASVQRPSVGEWLVLLMFIPAALLIGLLEELFFRGVVLQSLITDIGVMPAVVLSSTFYAVLHFAKYLREGWSLFPEMFGLFLFGGLLAYAYLRTRLLAMPVGLHMSLAYLAKMGRKFLVSYGREPAWLFGTDRWIDGAIGRSALLAGFFLITLLTRRRSSR